MEVINESIIDNLRAFPGYELPRVGQSVKLTKDEENILKHEGV